MKILKSLIVIAAMAALVVGVTNSFFDDEVTITDNTLTTGTIDIDVDGHDEDFTSPFDLTHMKPGYVKSSDFTVNNNGDNPANITKTVTVNDDTGSLAGVLDYKLSAEVFDGNTLKWWQMIYNYDTTLAAVNHTEVFLGMLPAGWNMKVHESYRMSEEAGNGYQDKTMTFNITIKAEQLKGNVVLENKNGPPNWDIIQDSYQGTLDYDVMASMFNFTFNGVARQNNTEYTLVIGTNPWDNSDRQALASGSTDGSGNISLNGSIDLDTRTNQKVWLVLTSDWNGGAWAGWHADDYLFETGLIDYYEG